MSTKDLLDAILDTLRETSHAAHSISHGDGKLGGKTAISSGSVQLKTDGAMFLIQVIALNEKARE